MKTILISLTVILFLASCSDNNVQVTGPIKDMIIGTWMESDLGYPVRTMIRADSLRTDKYGFIFHSEGKFTNLDAGWCGTPPLFYSKCNGTWTMLSDSVVSIDVEYWGGRQKYNMKIISLENLNLKYERE